MTLQNYCIKTASMLMFTCLLSMTASCNNEDDNGKNEPAVEKDLLSTDFMMTYICPNNILELGDVIMSYYSEDGKEINDTLSLNDFTKGEKGGLSVTISGSPGTDVKKNEMYWQKKLHYNKYNVQQQFLIWFLPKVSSYSFTSVAYVDAITKDKSGNKVESLPFNINVISPTVIGISINTDPELAEKKLLFGEKYYVNANGQITSQKVKEADVKEHLLNDEQYSYLTDCVKQLLNKAYINIDEVIAALPNDGEERKEFEFTDQLPEKLFGKSIDIAYVLTPYIDIVSFECRVKLPEDAEWNWSMSACNVDDLAKSLRDANHLKRLVDDFYEKLVYNNMNK